MGKVLISIIILIIIIAGCVAEKKEAVPVITDKTDNEKISNVEANLRKLVSENSNSGSTTDSAIQKGVYVSSSDEIKYYSFEYLIDTKNSELLKKIAENLISEEENGKVSTFVVLKDGLALNGNELESSSLTDAKKVEASVLINSETTVKDMRLNINKKSGQASVRCTLFQENGKAGIKISKDEKSSDEIKNLFNTKNRVLIQLTNDTESKSMKMDYTVNNDESGNSIISFTDPILNSSSNSKGYTVKLGDVKGFFVFTFMDTNSINSEKIYIEDSKIVLDSSSVNIKV